MAVQAADFAVAKPPPAWQNAGSTAETLQPTRKAPDRHRPEQQ
jgi:hypothetical protein